MQLRKTMMMLTALSALSVVMTGCPTDEEGSLTCSTDVDCLEGELCHPTAKTCVQTCTSASDCPASARADCTAVSATDSRKVCNCATDQLCNSEGATDLVCSTLDKVCAPKCTADADCGAGRTCDTATGQCEAGGTGATCTGTSQSTCSYGQFCSNSKCEAAPVAPATCQNLSSERPNWSATSSNGPVIYSATTLRYETNSANCSANSDAYIISIRAYRTDANWPDTRAGLSGFFYVNTGGSKQDIVNLGLLVPNTGYNRNPNNLKDAEFQTYLCTNVSSVQAAYYFTGGNPICQTFTKP